MDLILEIQEKARRLGRRIVLPESQDPRVRQAAATLASKKLCIPVLVDSGRAGTPPAGVEVVFPARDPRTGKFAEELFELRQAKGMTIEEARDPTTSTTRATIAPRWTCRRRACSASDS
jgi:phosphate acetyltransferase